MDNKEIIYDSSTVELRMLGEEGNEEQRIVGRALTYEVESMPIQGKYTEVIKRGALDKADMTQAVARAIHSNAALLGTVRSGTLLLRAHADGMDYEVSVPNTTAGKDAAVYVERGDYSGSSFAYIPDLNTIKWVTRSGQLPMREVYNIIGVYDVSPVINPAYPETTTALRELETMEAEDLLQEKLKAESASLTAIHKHKNYQL